MTESGAQLFARLEARRCLKDIEPRLFPEDGGPEHGEVVELYGPEGTGKSELLYHLLCRCVLPVDSGGLEVDVVFIDTEFNLDMMRLVSILDHRLHTAHPTSTESSVRACLSRLLVVHCSSSSQLLLTLHFLETSFTSRPGLALLLIDSISAFYWPDRSAGGGAYRQEEKLSKCAELLGRLLRDYRITVFATCHTIRRSYNYNNTHTNTHTNTHSYTHTNTNPSPSTSTSTSTASLPECDRPFLCRRWQQLVTHRLLCSKQEVMSLNKMAADSASDATSSGGAQGESSSSIKIESRRRIRKRSVFTVKCNAFRVKKESATSFCVTDGGVEFM